MSVGVGVRARARVCGGLMGGSVCVWTVGSVCMGVWVY